MVFETWYKKSKKFKGIQKFFHKTTEIYDSTRVTINFVQFESYFTEKKNISN